MTSLVSKCGIDCRICPWGPYPRKDMIAKEFEQYRKKAKEILGYMPIKTPCVTCQTPDEKIPKTTKLPNKKCLIRKCVDKTGIKNCAYCTRFPCQTLKDTAGLWNRKSIEEKIGGPLSDKDYNSFVKAFEGLNRLLAIRSSLKPNEIVEPAKTLESKTIIVKFPDNLPIKKDLASFKNVHKLISNIEDSSLGLKNTDTFAQKHKLKNQKEHVLRFLWILANYGEFDKSHSCLVVDAKTYYVNRGKQKTLSIWSFVKEIVFKILAEFGVCCERIKLKGLKDEDLTTGTGYLRNKGWVMRMSFEEKIGGNAALKALQIYVKRLDQKYGSKAFQRFRNADLTILLDTY